MNLKKTRISLPHSPLGLLLDREVRHAARESRPHFTRKAVLDFADGDAELDELLLGLVEAGPLVAVPVEAGVEEAVATTTAGLELVGEFREHVVDLLAVLLDATGVEAHGLDDALGDDVAIGILAVLEQASHEDGLDTLRSENLDIGAHYFTFSSIFGDDAFRVGEHVFFCNTQDEVPKRSTLLQLTLCLSTCQSTWSKSCSTSQFKIILQMLYCVKFVDNTFTDANCFSVGGGTFGRIGLLFG